VASLSLASNQLNGNIPPELGSLSNLRYLYLNNNQLSGSIPPELGSLSLLIDLYLNNNQLSGSIPPELGSLTTLWYLYLNNNQLSGAIPAALANLTGLTGDYTDLGYNRLTASGPSLLAFLAAIDPDWAATQTVPPANVRAVGASLTWTPIAYTGDGGYYVVSYATKPGGPYTVAGQTTDKTASGYTVAGLQYSTTYYFAVQSYTLAHGGQQNALTSDYSQEVSVTTSAANAIPQRAYFTTTTPTLTWNRISWAAGYEIQVATDKTFSAVVYTKSDLTAGDLSVIVNATPSLHKGVYYWRVRALRAGGSAGAWSAVDSFVVDVAP
jgi:hypothetical protein